MSVCQMVACRPPSSVTGGASFQSARQSSPGWRASTAARLARARPSFVEAPSRPARSVWARAEADQVEKDDLGIPVDSVYSEEQQDAMVVKFREHQESAARISNAEETRTLMAASGTAVLSTTSVAKISEGYPYGSVISIAVDDKGRPVIAVSTLSLHTSDLKADAKCSVTVTSGSFNDLSDARATVTGEMTPVPEDERDAVRSVFLEKHPQAFYVDFGDFSFFRMDKIVSGHLVGGFGRVAQIQADDYLGASADPIAPFSAPVAGHMNADHGDAISAMVRQFVGVPVEDPKILSLDRLGMNLEGVFFDMPTKIRLPFPRPAEDRKDVKTLLVDMTKAAAEHMPKKAAEE